MKIRTNVRAGLATYDRCAPPPRCAPTDRCSGGGGSTLDVYAY
jgi:hypothetical protein